MPEELEAAITEKTKYIIVGYPNNPTGAVMTLEDWAGSEMFCFVIPALLFCQTNFTVNLIILMANRRHLRSFQNFVSALLWLTDFRKVML